MPPFTPAANGPGPRAGRGDKAEGNWAGSGARARPWGPGAGGPCGAVLGTARRRKNARLPALRGTRRTLLEQNTEPTGRVETGPEPSTPNSAGLLQQSLLAQASRRVPGSRAGLAQQKGGGGGAQSRESLVPHGLRPGGGSPAPGPCTYRARLPPLSPLDPNLWPLPLRLSGQGLPRRPSP